jgi:hypothetical protein
MEAHLPVELWFEIFRYLDYFTLRTLYRHKCFHYLLNSSALDQALFRLSTENELENCLDIDSEVEAASTGGPRLHPFLAQLGSFIDYSLPRNSEQLLIQPRTIDGSTKPWRFLETNLPDDSAVLPPPQVIQISLMDGYAKHHMQSRIESQARITVEMVMKLMLEMVNGYGKWAWENIGSQGLEARFIGWEIKHDGGEIVKLVAKYGV